MEVTKLTTAIGYFSGDSGNSRPTYRTVTNRQASESLLVYREGEIIFKNGNFLLMNWDKLNSNTTRFTIFIF